jgi:Cdc6-like AAA superfamily ATPase
LSDDQLIEQFYTASSDLLTWPATFERLGDYHIERAETTSLLNWVEEPLMQEPNSKELATPIAVLVGGAGYGKTTVLRDLLQRLHQQKIPVIGLKADRLMISHRNDLEQELRLPDHIDVLVKRLSIGYQRIVVLVDQLDALSQSLSADRQILQVYNRLIEQLSTLPHTRIVVSCRQFDLEYDPALKQYQKKHIISLAPLSESDVKEVLKQIGLSEHSLTPKLYELLKVPLHLDIFCKVYREVADISSLATVQDLYH